MSSPVSAGSVVVEVQADFRRLDVALADASRRIDRFAGSERRDPLTGILGDSRALRAQADSVVSTHAAMLGRVESQEEDSLVRLKAKRSQSIGAFRVGAAGVGAGAAIFAGIQAFRAAAEGLRATGDEAFTTEGRIRNLAAALSSGDIVGGLQALTAHESRIAPDLEKAVGHLQQMREEASRVSLEDVFTDAAQFRSEAAQITKDLVSIGIPIGEAKQKTAEWRQELQAAAATTVDLGGTVSTVFGNMLAQLDDLTSKAVAARKQGLSSLAQLPPGIGAAIAREQGPEGSEAGQLKVLQQADANLARRIEETRKQGSTRDVSEALKRLQEERNRINSQIEALTAPDKQTKPPTLKQAAAPIVPVALENRLAQAELQGVSQYVKALRVIETFLERAIKAERDINRQLEERRRLKQVRREITSLTTKDSAAAVDPSFPDLFQGPVLTSPQFQFAKQFGFKPRPKDLLADLKAQVRERADFLRQIGRLKKQGAPAQLVDEFLQRGPESVDELKAIAGGPAGLRQQIFGQFKQLERQEQKIARLDVTSQDVTITATNVTIGGGGIAGSDWRPARESGGPDGRARMAAGDRNR